MDDRASFEIEGAVDWPQDDSVRAVVARIAWREPVSLLRARRDPALVARWLGQETVADETADLVAVAIHGATTVLAIGKRTGHVLEARFPARTVTGDRPVVQRYSAFQKSGGLTLPHVSVRVVDGVVSRSPTLKLAAVSPEKSLDVGLFSPRD
jgi:hypothetical protein